MNRDYNSRLDFRYAASSFLCGSWLSGAWAWGLLVGKYVVKQDAWASAVLRMELWYIFRYVDKTPVCRRFRSEFCVLMIWIEQYSLSYSEKLSSCAGSVSDQPSCAGSVSDQPSCSGSAASPDQKQHEDTAVAPCGRNPFRWVFNWVEDLPCKANKTVHVKSFFDFVIVLLVSVPSFFKILFSHQSP